MLSKKDKSAMTPFYIAILLVLTTFAAISGTSLQYVNPPYLNPKTVSAFDHPRMRTGPWLPENTNRMVGLAKQQSSSELIWLNTASKRFIFDTITHQWIFSNRDTSIYNSSGQVICHKSTSAKTGWLIDSLITVDSILWDGSRQIENTSLSYRNGVLKDTISTRTAWQYSNDYKVCVFSYNVLILNKWVAVSLDSTIYAVPFNVMDHYGEYDSPDFLSYKKYYLNNLSGEMQVERYYAKSILESNDSLYVMLAENRRTLDSDLFYYNKIFIRFYKNGTRCDSTIIKDTAGNWVNWSVTTSSYDADSTWTQFEKQFNNGAWEKGKLYIFSKTEERLFYYWDSVLQDWQIKIFEKINAHNKLEYVSDIRWNRNGTWDTTFQQRQDMVYDSNGNMVSYVYSNKDSTNPWIKRDSIVYAYEQLKVSAKTTSPKGRLVPPVYSLTSKTLCISAPEITGVRMYAVTGRLVFSFNQPAAPVFRLDLKGIGCSRMSVGRYVVQVESGKRMQTFPLLLMD